MKTFFDGIFMNSEKLEEEGKEYPIKLEYYKTIAMEENVEAKYGMEIVKTEYINGTNNIESSIVENVTNDAHEADKILTILRNNEVTPIVMQDVLDDMFVKATYRELAE